MLINSIEKLKQCIKKKEDKHLFRSQIQSINEKSTKNGNPYYELKLCDGKHTLTLRAWSNTQIFNSLKKFKNEQFVEIDGNWQNSENYGLEAKNWNIRLLNQSETDEFLAGSPETLQKQQNDLDFIKKTIANINDPRLKLICQKFLQKYKKKFITCAAARDYHHARPGGLLEHVASMTRAGLALTQVYQHINQDLLIAGILFHDCGKLWENSYNENSLTMPHNEIGELIGHISLGIEVANKLWLEIMQQNPDFEKLQPHHEQVKLHLLHLIGSHHGEFEWGAPVLPKTPEAIILHFIDNIDAKLEMFNEAYKIGNELTPKIIAKRRPLRQNYIKPLEKYNPKTAEIPLKQKTIKKSSKQSKNSTAELFPKLEI